MSTHFLLGESGNGADRMGCRQIAPRVDGAYELFAIVAWIGEDRGTLVCSAVQMADRKPVPTFGLHCDSEAVGDLGKTLVEGPEHRVRGESR